MMQDTDSSRADKTNDHENIVPDGTISGQSSQTIEREVFTEAGFWRKLTHYAQQSGKDVVEAALKLFYAWQDPDTPKSAKAVIVGALVYFIVPTDAVFDLLPGGYVDDWGALVGALWTVAKHIKPEHQEKAKNKLLDWFEGDDGVDV